MKLPYFINIVKKVFLLSGRFIKRYFQKERFIVSPVPNLTIETTNICNAKCVFCANRIMKRRRQHLDIDLFKKVVNDFAAMGGNNLDFCACIGEPLLDPHFLLRVGYLKRFPQIRFSGFYTTLQWLHKFDIQEFLELGNISLTISTALSGKEKYFEFFGADNYDRTLKNIVTLLEENKKSSNRIGIGFSIMRTNEPLECVINHPDFKLIDGLSDGALLASVKKRGLGVDDWACSVKLPSYLRKRPLYPRSRRPCGFFYNKLIIFSNGKIGVCPCRDFEADSELILGDIKNDSLSEIWNGVKLTSLRSNWRKKNIIPAICKRCSHYNY